MRIKWVLGLLIIILFINGCAPSELTVNELSVKKSTLKVEPIDLSNIQTEKLEMSKYYSLDPLDISIQVPEYKLPLSTGKISNYNDFNSKINLGDSVGLLNKNGFVIIKNPFNDKEKEITSPYETLKDKEIPIFITSDSLLHLYHIQFDETLRIIEEKEFYDKIWSIDKELLDRSIKDYNSASGDLKEAAKKNVAYLSVALSLLQPKTNQTLDCGERDWECLRQDKTAFFTKEELANYTFNVPDFVKNEVDKELELINTHSGFSISPIFKYNEDYSQYVPRGHYTRSEKLKNYFKAFMWHGRISMLLKGDLIVGDKEKEAKIQTISASLIASYLGSNKEIMDKWDKIYTVTAFYVGLSDDLGPYEYISSINSVFGNTFDPNKLNDDIIVQLKVKLAGYNTPKIYGGTGFGEGGCAIAPPYTSEKADNCLDSTKGFRFMGQRFIPDSYMFQKLVFAYVGEHFSLTPDTWDGKPFTSGIVEGPLGLIVTRVFPRGLDVMALLGSNQAKKILIDSGDTDYDGYEDGFNNLSEEFNSFTVKDWNKNLYWSWLYSLKSLLNNYSEGYPTFMKTDAWNQKQLHSALASWAELRHDTILYAKQSYTMSGTTGAHFEPPEPQVVGYIEPVPEFYNRLLALTRMTTKGLDEMEVLDETSKARLTSLETILGRLRDLSVKELENKDLEQEDYDFIKNFGKELNGVIADVDNKAKKTTIIADVHTNGNSGEVLEEGVGYVDLIVVAYKVPDGRILIGAGPVMSYYEFKQPIVDRLTDEKWGEMLEIGKQPDRPEWVNNFISLQK